MSKIDPLEKCKEIIKRFFIEEFEPGLSEGQLQFDLATFLKSEYINDTIYVEYPILYRFPKKNSYDRRSADIVIVIEARFIVIELKYKTTEDCNKGSNKFRNLVHQGGQTDGKRKFIEDIIKISDLKLSETDNKNNSEPTDPYIGGIAVFCSNDPSYHNWTGKAWGECKNSNYEQLENNDWIEFFKHDVFKEDKLISSPPSADFSRTIKYYPWKESKDVTFKHAMVLNRKD